MPHKGRCWLIQCRVVLQSAVKIPASVNFTLSSREMATKGREMATRSREMTTKRKIAEPFEAVALALFLLIANVGRTLFKHVDSSKLSSMYRTSEPTIYMVISRVLKSRGRYIGT